MDVKKLRIDWEQIIDEYPGLSLVQEHDGFSLIGKLKFNANYKTIPIADSYDVKIILHNYPEDVPIAIETGNRILKNKDNHISSDGIMCLGNRLECHERFNHRLSNFIKDILIPFLYANSFKERYGKYPWHQLAHFSTGILEYYQEKLNLTRQEVITLFQNIRKFHQTKGHSPCLCGKTTRFRNCCRNKLEDIINDPVKSQLFYKDITEVLKALTTELKQKNFSLFFTPNHTRN